MALRNCLVPGPQVMGGRGQWPGVEELDKEMVGEMGSEFIRWFACERHAQSHGPYLVHTWSVLGPYFICRN